MDLDFPREWVSFTDPADPEHEIRADVTWLLSTWGCIFGRGCAGVVAGRASDGCCSHGAFFSDAEDEKRTRKFAKQLTDDEWQLAAVGRRQGVTEWDEAHGEKRKRTRTVDGACVFLNRPGFAGGAGCALHGHALRTGLHPLETKPDVCWQLPIVREQRRVTTVDERDLLITTITEFDRRQWGTGGADLHWWCTEAPEAHGAGVAVFASYGPELTALIGAPAYAELARLLELKRTTGTAAPHPADPTPR